MIQQAEKFSRAIEQRCKGLHVSLGSSGLEGAFSIKSCDSCGTKVAGHREPAVGVSKRGDKLYWRNMVVCMDCVSYFIDNELPREWS